jgi:hypothetical protein
VSASRGNHHEKNRRKYLFEWRDSVIREREEARRRNPLSVHEILGNRIRYTLKKAFVHWKIRCRLLDEDEGITILYNYVIGMEDESVSILYKLTFYNLVISLEDEGVEAAKQLWLFSEHFEHGLLQFVEVWW